MNIAGIGSFNGEAVMQLKPRIEPRLCGDGAGLMAGGVYGPRRGPIISCNGVLIDLSETDSRAQTDNPIPSPYGSIWGYHYIAALPLDGVFPLRRGSG